MKLQERLRQLRAANHMTQAEAAEQLHLTRQALSSYETGRTQPDLETLERLAEIYGVTLEALLCCEETKGETGRRMRRLLRGLEGLMLLCALVRAELLWVANRFYAVPPGQVSPELKAVLETRFALTGAATWVEYALLWIGFWLGVALLIQGARRTVPASKLWEELGVFAAGMQLVIVPWNLADPLFVFWDYGYVVAVLCGSALFLAVGLLAGRLLRSRK